MGRTSKRLFRGNTEKERNLIDKGKIYKAGIYARISSDQNPDKAVSIETQVKIAEKFVEEWNGCQRDKIQIIERYIDLGKTGSNFNRNGFERLMQAVRLGEINCVIVKDLSRFGRNYLEAGNYIERIFPFLEIRFIAVSDGFDTALEKNGSSQISAEIKNLVNDMYAKEFSKKAKIHLEQRRQEGSYVGGPPPYGYKTVWEDGLRKLAPDENTAVIVRHIFKKFVEEQCYLAVVNDLNKRRINPPSVYKREGEIYCPEDAVYKGWERSSVKLILESENYIGRLVQGKTRIIGRNEANRVKAPASQWVIKEYAHEPLVDVRLFREAGEIRDLLRQQTKSRNSLLKRSPLEENIFAKVLYCGVCGCRMTRTIYRKQRADGAGVKNVAFICRNSVSTKTEACPEVSRISKQKLEDILFVLFQREFSVHMGGQKKYVKKGKENLCQSRGRLQTKGKAAENAIARLREEESAEYIDYRTGYICQKEYESSKMQREDRLEELTRQMDSIMKEEKTLEERGTDYLKRVHWLAQWKREQELTKDFMETFIDRIYVYPGKKVEVIFLYTDEFQERTDVGCSRR